MTTKSLSHDDKNLRQVLLSLAADNEEFWSFAGSSYRGQTHGFFQYPAMMVPQMQKIFLKAAHKIVPEVQTVYDAFTGSGTVMTESMMGGFDFMGQDINPLAVLLCRTKCGPMQINALEKNLALVSGAILNDAVGCGSSF